MKKLILGRKSIRDTFRPHLESLETRLTPTIYNVTTLADSGDGSLRSAITNVNADTTADEIDFSIAGVTQLSSGALPAITNTVKINGATAPGGNVQVPVVEIDNHAFAGLIIAASNSTLTTMSIVNASGPGVTLEGDNITVVSNGIGVSTNGSVAGNTGVGLFIDRSSGDTIGGTAPAISNLIGGNGGGGIQLGSSGSSQFLQNATILGNDIGIFGSVAFPNQGNGITIFSTGNTIGGTGNGAPNAIANNAGSGVVVSAGTQNAILGNLIFSNAGPGIQLVNNGNQNQPAPVLTSASGTSGTAGFTVQVTGNLTAQPNTKYVLEFFATATTSGSVFQLYSGSQIVTTNASGIAVFSFPDGFAPAPQEFTFAATATNSSTNDTSAFSNSIPIGSASNSNFIANAYPLLLNRPADASASFWVNGLNSGTFTPVTAVLGIEGSGEYVTDQVDAMYLHYLDRAADPQGEQYWVSVVQAGGTFEQVAEGLVSSQEYFALEGGTNQGFITGLYQEVLDRKPTTAELTGWETFLDEGASRNMVAIAFLTSQEYRTNLVQADYMTYLQRPAEQDA